MAGIIYPNIEKRRKDLGTPKAHMAKRLGISETALANKMDGTSEFTAREVRSLAKWWNVSSDSLIDEAIELDKIPDAT